MDLQIWRARLHDELRPDTEKGRMVRATGLTVALKIAAAGLAFIASLLYARTLGPHGYGLYAYVIAWSALLTIPAGLGLPAYLVREGAHQPDASIPLRRWADRRVLIAGLGAALVLVGLSTIPSAAGARWLFLVAAPIPLLSSLSAIRRSLLQANGWVVRSQWPHLILAPVVMLSILAMLWIARGRLLPIELVICAVGVALLPWLVNSYQLHRKRAGQPLAQPLSPSLRSALPFMWLGGLYLLISRTDLIMLGTLKGAHDAGIYAVASRIAELISLFMAAANTSLAPKISQLYRSGERTILQRLLQQATRRIMLGSLPVAMVLFLGAPYLLHMLYGIDYQGGAPIMRTLAVAQIVVVVGGPLGTVLNMTGHERLNLLVMSAAALINAGLNLLLIPHFGGEGAAVSTCVSLAGSRIALWYLVRSRVGLRPSGLGY